MQLKIMVGVDQRRENDANKVLLVLRRRLRADVVLADEDETQITFSLPSRALSDNEAITYEKGLLLGIIIGVLEGEGVKVHSHSVS